MRPATRRERAYDELDELYASLPAIACKGLCHDSCTTTQASELENDRIEERHGFRLPPFLRRRTLDKMIAAGNTPRCPALRADNMCGVYALRPLICRGFGAVLDPDLTQVQEMLCEHGCLPDGYVRKDEFMRALVEIETLSREITGRQTPRPL